MLFAREATGTTELFRNQKAMMLVPGLRDSESIPPDFPQFPPVKNMPGRYQFNSCICG
jgi:hypothetical protein